MLTLILYIIDGKFRQLHQIVPSNKVV